MSTPPSESTESIDTILSKTPLRALSPTVNLAEQLAILDKENPGGIAGRHRARCVTIRMVCPDRFSPQKSTAVLSSSWSPAPRSADPASTILAGDHGACDRRTLFFPAGHLIGELFKPVRSAAAPQSAAGAPPLPQVSCWKAPEAAGYYPSA